MMHAELSAAAAASALAPLMAAHFPVCARLRAIMPLGRGLINDSFRVVTEEGDYVLQRINPQVFRWPERIMANLWRLQSAVRDCPHQAPRLPQLYPTATGAAFARDSQGQVWRLLEFIADSDTLPRLTTRAQAHEVGQMLGAFHRFGATLDCRDFALTLPELHHTPIYWDTLCQACARASSTMATDPVVVKACEFFAARAPLYAALEEACARGEVRPQVIHGDPKLDNLLFDRHNERALCLIDLDTVQPGLPHHDLADCLRSCCNCTVNNGPGCFDLTWAEEIMTAYAAATAGLFQPAERAHWLTAIRVLPLELGMRYLADHLAGDRYFRVAYRGQNLVKAQRQIALATAIEQHQTALQVLIERCWPDHHSV